MERLIVSSEQDATTAQIQTVGSVTRAADIVGASVPSARQDRAFAAAVANRGSSGSALATVSGANAQVRAVFNQAFDGCLADFKALAGRLMKEIDETWAADESAAVLDLPKLLRDFRALKDPLCKALLVLGLVGVGALLANSNWESITSVWGKVTEFVQSETGIEILNTTADALAQLNRTGIVGAFETLLVRATEEQRNEGADMDTDVTGEMSESLNIIRSQAPVVELVTVVSSLFTFMDTAISH